MATVLLAAGCCAEGMAGLMVRRPSTQLAKRHGMMTRAKRMSFMVAVLNGIVQLVSRQKMTGVRGALRSRRLRTFKGVAFGGFARWGPLARKF